LFRGQECYRDLLLFVVGINTSLRISDLLTLRIGYFIDYQDRIKQRFQIHEQKRDKRHKVVIKNSIEETLEEYIDTFQGVTDNPDHFIFFNTKSNNFSVPIKRGQAWKTITAICQEVGLHGNYGTHSLRKTMGNLLFG